MDSGDLIYILASPNKEDEDQDAALQAIAVLQHLFSVPVTITKTYTRDPHNKGMQVIDAIELGTTVPFNFNS